MGKASRRRAQNRIGRRTGAVPSERDLAMARAIKAACDEAGVTPRLLAVQEALRSAFFGQNLNRALYRMREKPKTLEEARDVVLAVLRDSFGCDTTDLVLKLHVARGVDERGAPFERLSVTSVAAHPRIITPVIERFKAAEAGGKAA